MVSNSTMHNSSASTPGGATLVVAVAATTTYTTTASSAQPLQRKFPRDWLQKLVHGDAGGGGEIATTATTSTTSTSTIDSTRTRSWPPIYAVAPMVDQSDLPFRLQCRQYGAQLCYTPMIHAKLFVTQKSYRKKFRVREQFPQDRPLIAQLCGADHHYVLETAKLLQDHVDGIDINCGCPQQIAKRGHYGAYLLEDQAHLLRLVQELSQTLSVPVSVKVRLLPTTGSNSGTEQQHPPPDAAASLALYRALVDAGASLLTIHGRTRYQKGHDTGSADWDVIRTAVQQLGHIIPILANGNIANCNDVRRCLEYTGADGVMSSEAILEYPPLFWPLTTNTDTTNNELITTKMVPSVDLALEYINYAEQYPPDQQGQGNGFKTVRNHMHRFLHGALAEFTNVRDLIVRSKSLDELRAAILVLRDIHGYTGFQPLWYHRHLRRPSNNKNNHIKEEETTTTTTTAKNVVITTSNNNNNNSTSTIMSNGATASSSAATPLHTEEEEVEKCTRTMMDVVDNDDDGGGGSTTTPPPPLVFLHTKKDEPEYHDEENEADATKRQKVE
jgi:tRNA-dihydrouridine synthase 1